MVAMDYLLHSGYFSKSKHDVCMDNAEQTMVNSTIQSSYFVRD